MITMIGKSLDPRRFISKRKRGHLALLVSIVTFVVLLILWFKTNLTSQASKQRATKCGPQGLEPHFTRENSTMEKPKADNWIVVTTIYGPSPQLEALGNLKNWQLLIIADEKTPAALWKSHRLPGSIYLDLEMQKELPYCIVPLIPTNSYTRKNIGYLYAIQHGAKYIYDIDDDNMPETQESEPLYFFSTQSSQSGFLAQPKGSVNIINPYPHFGKDNIWPRGFPLHLINSQQTKQDLFEHFSLQEYHFDGSVVIRHGLVNGDPDVDAIYRLTHSNHKNVNLQRNKPIILGNKLYGLFNSQNTLFGRSAFWGLILPLGVTMRVTDIWRSYWSQTLMKLTNQKLAILWTNVNQTRNKHSYLDDFIEENDLYVKTGHFLEYLSSWECHNEQFLDCIIQLSYDLVNWDFWTYKDAYLAEAWLYDLKSLGYVFPDI